MHSFIHTAFMCAYKICKLTMIIMRDPGIITLGYILDIEILKWLCGVSVSGRGRPDCVCVCVLQIGFSDQLCTEISGNSMS